MHPPSWLVLLLPGASHRATRSINRTSSRTINRTSDSRISSKLVVEEPAAELVVAEPAAAEQPAPASEQPPTAEQPTTVEEPAAASKQPPTPAAAAVVDPGTDIVAVTAAQVLGPVDGDGSVKQDLAEFLHARLLFSRWRSPSWCPRASRLNPTDLMWYQLFQIVDMVMRRITVHAQHVRQEDRGHCGDHGACSSTVWCSTVQQYNAGLCKAV